MKHMDEQEKLLPPKAYARLWLNEWQLERGDALDRDDIEACVAFKHPMSGREEGWIFVAGLDLSATRNRSALVVFAIEPVQHRVRVAYAKSWKPDSKTRLVNLISIQNEIANVHRLFRLEKLLYDQYQARLMMQQLEALGIRSQEMSFMGHGASVMATTLLEAFKSRQVELYRHDELIADLQRLNIVERGFNFKIEAAVDAEGGHADLGFAFSIALPAAMELSSELPINPFTPNHIARTFDELMQQYQDLQDIGERDELPMQNCSEQKPTDMAVVLQENGIEWE
jgi:hypothetical protein